MIKIIEKYEKEKIKKMSNKNIVHVVDDEAWLLRGWVDFTDEEISKTFQDFGVQVKGSVWTQVARAIEKKLKVKNGF